MRLLSPVIEERGGEKKFLQHHITIFSLCNLGERTRHTTEMLVFTFRCPRAIYSPEFIGAIHPPSTLKENVSPYYSDVLGYFLTLIPANCNYLNIMTL